MPMLVLWFTIAAAWADPCSGLIGKQQLQCFANNYPAKYKQVEAACMGKADAELRKCRVNRYQSVGLAFVPANGGAPSGGSKAEVREVVRAVAIGVALTAAGQALTNTPSRCAQNPQCRLSPDEQATFAAAGQALSRIAPQATAIASSNKSREQQRREIAALIGVALGTEALQAAFARLSPDGQQALGLALQGVNLALEQH